MRTRWTTVALALMVWLAAAAPAAATFRGADGRIAIGTNRGIISVGPTGKGLRREPGTTRHDGYPLWSRDGRSLAFTRESDFDNPDDGSPASEQSLYVRPDGGTPFLVHRADYRDPCGGTPQDFAIGWSTDGGSVLAHHSGWDGPFEDFEPGYSDCNGSGAVFSARLDGSPPTWYGAGHTGCRGLFPDSAAPDASRVAGGDPCHHDAVVATMLTPWKTSTLWRPPRGALIGTIDWSPNGSRLVFDLSRPTRAGSTRLLGIYVLPAAGGRAHRIVRGGYLPVWSPSGRRIAYVDEHGLETVSTAGRHRRHLRRFKSWEALQSYPLSMSWQPRP